VTTYKKFAEMQLINVCSQRKHLWLS